MHHRRGSKGECRVSAQMEQTPCAPSKMSELHIWHSTGKTKTGPGFVELWHFAHIIQSVFYRNRHVTALHSSLWLLPPVLLWQITKALMKEGLPVRYLTLVAWRKVAGGDFADSVYQANACCMHALSFLAVTSQMANMDPLFQITIQAMVAYMEAYSFGSIFQKKTHNRCQTHVLT